MAPKWKKLWSLPGRRGLSMYLLYTTNIAELFHKVLQHHVLMGRRLADMIEVLRRIFAGPFATEAEAAKTYIRRISLQLRSFAPDGAYSAKPKRVRLAHRANLVRAVPFHACA